MQQQVEKNKISISCFLEDIAPTFEVLKMLLDSSSGLFGVRRFENGQLLGFSKTDIYKKPGLFLDFVRYPCVSNDKNNWFWEVAQTCAWGAEIGCRGGNRYVDW